MAKKKAAPEENTNQKTIDELLDEVIRKELALLQDKLSKASDLKTMYLLRQQILKVKTEIEEIEASKPKKKVPVQLDFTQEMLKPDFKSLQMGVEKK